MVVRLTARRVWTYLRRFQIPAHRWRSQIELRSAHAHKGCGTKSDQPCRYWECQTRSSDRPTRRSQHHDCGMRRDERRPLLAARLANQVAPQHAVQHALRRHPSRRRARAWRDYVDGAAVPGRRRVAFAFVVDQREPLPFWIFECESQTPIVFADLAMADHCSVEMSQPPCPRV